MKPIAAIQCPFCHSKRKVLYLYPSDTFWCAKCSKYGSVSEIKPELLLSRDLLTPSESKNLTEYSYNNNGDRFSVCKERNFYNGVDVFQIKLPDGSVVGHYSRKPGKISHTEGIRGVCYREEFLDLKKTYRIVEGTYDCIYPDDVAVLGYPTVFQAKQLSWYKLILCPDGDVWQNTANLFRWLKPFWNHKDCVLEYIPEGLDPDECVLANRKTVSFHKVKTYLKGLYG